MLSGVVLAGGKGSRMGGDKGLVEVCSRPMLLHVIDAVCHVAEDIIVAVGKDCGPRYAELLGARVRLAEDTVPGRGPLEGLSSGFGLAREAYVVVAPCDVPLIMSGILELLASRASGKDGAVPVIRGYHEPLVAVYRRDVALRSFTEELARGTGKVGNALKSLDLEMVDERDLRKVDPDLLSFRNVNSLDDLRVTEELVARNASKH